ncbi:hypothetical protein P7C71_g3219, partial [Lecanoromycetidae sp. Uapishka_2]
MAPGLTDTLQQQAHNFSKPLPRSIFPDGIKTSGQHPPLYEELRPYEDFPSEITGATVWNAEDYKNNPERWTHHFKEEEIAELSKAADDFRAAEIPLTGYLESIRKELLDGKGFILFKGFPVEKWGNHKSAIAYMGLGTYLGYFVSQNGKGHVLGHVKDLGEDATQIDKVRIYRTNARQFFHADDSDLVGLLCIARALEGGESDIASVHQVYNVLQRERPDVLKTLTEPIWYFDRKGEVSKGEDPYIRASVFYLEPGGQGPQIEAADVLEATCKRLSLHMILEVGDIQFLSNQHVLHARTEYKDHAPPAPRRHLMRLWLATPEGEGGWKLPFHDRGEKKRGGIQVDDVGPVAHLDAE